MVRIQSELKWQQKEGYRVKESSRPIEKPHLKWAKRHDVSETGKV